MNPREVTLPDTEIDPVSGKLKTVELQQNSIVYNPLNRNLLYTKAEINALLAGISQGGGSGITALTGDVTASGSGSVAATVTFANDTLHVLRAGDTMTGSLVFNSTATTALTSYNTADQTTNFEKLSINWATNVLQIQTTSGGTGTTRSLLIGNTSFTQYNNGGATKIQHTFVSTSTNPVTGVGIGGTLNASTFSGPQIAFGITPTINQSLTAGYTVLLINPTQTSTGSGSNLLFDAQVGGSSLFKIDNSGNVTHLGTYNSRNIKPNTTATYDVGATTLYYNNLFATRLNLNSTAYWDGGTAGQISTTAPVQVNVTGAVVPVSLIASSLAAAITISTTAGLVGEGIYINMQSRGRIGYKNGHVVIDDGRNAAGGTADGSSASKDLQIWMGTLNLAAWNTTGLALGVTAADISLVAPTHTLTLNSTATGIAYYNTVDQTTNYERGIVFWSTNVFSIRVQNGGTGTARSLQIGDGQSTVTYQSGSTVKITQTAGASGTGGSIGYQMGQTVTSSSGAAQIGVNIAPTINQTGSASYTALQINSTETAVGSGAKLLADFQVGSSSKFNIDNTGKVTKPVGGAASSAGTATLVGGTVTINTTAVTANSLIFLTDTASSLTNVGNLSVSGKSAGVSFTVTSANALDTSTFNWVIIN